MTTPDIPRETLVLMLIQRDAEITALREAVRVLAEYTHCLTDITDRNTHRIYIEAKDAVLCNAICNAALDAARKGGGTVSDTKELVSAIRQRIGQHKRHGTTDGVLMRLAEQSADTIEQLESHLANAEQKLAEAKHYEPKLWPPDFPRELRIVAAMGALANLVAAFDALNGEANYTETEFRTSERTYFVTVRRGDKPTDHQLRKQAESRLALAERVVEAAEAIDADFLHDDDPKAPEGGAFWVGQQRSLALRTALTAYRERHTNPPA